jgi:hypothetical protein
MKLQIVDRLAELPYRLRPPVRAQPRTWELTTQDLQRVAIVWPTRYQWPEGAGILETLKFALSELGVMAVKPTMQVHKGVTLLHCTIDGREHRVALDYSDYPDFINAEALAESSLYLKGQYRSGGYPDSKIVHGGYTCTGLDYYRFYTAYRERFINNRQIDVVGRFGFTFQGEIRRKGVALLSAANDIKYVGATGKVRYSRFLREVASSRLCFHLPGNGPFTHRVAEFLGLGSCMISVRFATELEMPLEPGVHYVEVADDLSDLVEKCRYYISHDVEREKIARAGRDFFDRYVHCDQVVSYYVRTMLDRLGSR